ncbi:conserved hypothetical protein [Rhodothermus marinus DSM 4252]|uniref:Uncharacterized protein n=2 Tax=Rhodothermus marinus TaxID=29549 RepID=D0MIB0_RHOM4|nr:conserved hypothetical protein [Rhodothermus marinus DSM 4252]
MVYQNLPLVFRISSITTIRRIVDILQQIPLEAWEHIVACEPEWHYMSDLLPSYGEGPFAVLMVTAGLNDFQLKGKAEKAYWPVLKKYLVQSPIPDRPEDLIPALAPFYAGERLPELKLRRLRRFLQSHLAQRMWLADASTMAPHFQTIWLKLARIMEQSPEQKTIVFAMKCLGIAFLIAGERNFSFEKIPIPVDFRVRMLTRRLTRRNLDDEAIRFFWNQVLQELQRTLPVTMIHLDSLVWQIGNLADNDLIAYFQRFNLDQVGKRLVDATRQQDAL